MALKRLQHIFKVASQVGPTQATLFALYKLGVKSGHYKRVESRGVENSPSALKPLFSIPDREQLEQVLGENGRNRLLAEADEIVSGSFYMFGDKLEEIKLIFDQPLHHWADYEINPQLLSKHHSPISDIKFSWEPARFGWAYILGRGYFLSQNESYAEAFWKFFEQFTENNPPNLGPHWMNGQEVAIRLMALVWAGQVFDTAAASSVERRARLARSIAEHAARIPHTLGYARAQNNNHLVTEAAGLYTAGLALPDHPQSAHWRTLGWRWLNWSFQHQISGYGEYIQHSANYHRLMLQTALWVNAIKDREWPRLTVQSLGRATHWLFSMLDPASGRTPNLGANDGALILPLAVTPFNDFRPTVQAAARAFLRFQMPAGVWDEMSLWLGLDAHEHSFESNLYMTDHLHGRDSWAYLRATQFHSRLGHMDQLHLDLWWRGLNIARDAGTYLYNADPPWNNPLVFTRVHNTVTVDGRDQMNRGSRFITLDWFPAYSKSIVPGDESVLGELVAYHKGYRQVRHERTVKVYNDERWLIEDMLISKKPHHYRLHWLLPDWEWGIETGEQRIEISLWSPQGRINLFLKAGPPISDLHSLISLVRAGEVVYGNRDVLPFEGWFSPTYGTKEPALSLAFEVQSVASINFITEFKFPHEN